MTYTTHGLMTAADLEEYRQDTDWYELNPQVGECVECGLAPCDLPDEVDPELVFERGDDGEWRCQVHVS